MSEATPEEAAPAADAAVVEGNAPAETEQQSEAKVFDADYVANLRKEAAKYRTEAKAQAAELEKFRKASMSESERAVAEAEARGRQTATAEYGKRLARASFDALAAKRNPEANTEELVEFLDMARFLGDDGEIDAKAIAAAVERIVPAPRTEPPAFDGGVRTSAEPGADMNKLMRGALGRT
jgi:uncharacterized heparinase superfamily protein